MKKRHNTPTGVTRRRFLQGLGAAAGLWASGCAPRGATHTPAPIAPPTIPPISSTPLARVAIAQAEGYDRALMRRQIEVLLDGLGGLGDVISPGDRVALKVNLTGGTNFQPPDGFSPTESYLTHPEVVRALGELLRDAGARELFIVEAVFDPRSYSL